MTTDQVDELATAAANAANAINARSAALLDQLRTIPGGGEHFRLELAMLNVSQALFEKLLRNELSTDELFALSSALAGLKISTN